ncbi:MAG: hypothetical protein EXS31_06975 [Pedosphaera sp.]|nr:hypothetical protein [Pedosphaera sp.]
MKRTYTITLDDYDAALLEQAIRIACRLRGDGDETQRSNRSFVLRWILRAVSAAIIRRGEMPQRLAVELRHETREETRLRLEKKIPDGPRLYFRYNLPPAWWN